MTFTKWKTIHDTKVKEILNRLDEEACSVDEIVEYFRYDNMVKKEPKFCPLYTKGIKCHDDIDNLNCLFCACPYFEYSDEEPLQIGEIAGENIMSRCKIQSEDRREFIYTDENGVTKIQCNCSCCPVPHSEEFIKRKLTPKAPPSFIEDADSFLEYLRAYQLQDMLGKYKLF